MSNVLRMKPCLVDRLQITDSRSYDIADPKNM